MNEMFVRPAKGATIPDPLTQKALGAKGEWVDRNSFYYQKLLLSEDVVELTGDDIPEEFRPGQEATIEGGQPPPSLDKMSADDLRAEAERTGVDVSGARSKRDLIAALSAKPDEAKPEGEARAGE